MILPHRDTGEDPDRRTDNVAEVILENPLSIDFLIAQEELRSHHECSDAGRVGHWRWELEDGVIELAPTWFNLIGWRNVEHNTTCPFDFYRKIVHPDDRDSYQQQMNAFISDSARETFEIRYRLRKFNGSDCAVMSRGKATVVEEGTKYYVAGVDIAVE